MMNGEEGRGSSQSVYKENEGKSLMWNPQQANTYRGAETKRNTFNCFLHLLTQTTSDHLLKTIKRRLKENNHLHNLFYIFPSYLLFFPPGTDGLLSTSLCWTIWIWMRKILFTLSLRIATVLPWEWKTACGKTTRRCTSMQSGGYLPSLATVSSHLCTVDNMTMHDVLKCDKYECRRKYDTFSAIVYIKAWYQDISMPRYAWLFM